MFDLKYFREEILKETQQELAAKVGVRQDMISRMERSPEKITIEQLKRIADATGYSMTDLANMEQKRIEPINVNDYWGSPIELKNRLNRSLDEFLKKDRNIFIKNDLINLKENIEQIVRKPRIAFLGNSDVGKSTMINSLLGQDVLPAGWTPTTSLPILIKHIDERPHFMTDSTFILNENILSNKVNEYEMKDEQYFDSLLLESGNVNLISEFGSRQGNKYDQHLAKSIVTYVNSPILHTCELLDLPGFGTGDRSEDDFIADIGRQTADVFVYLSIVNGFMRGTDIEYLKEAIKLLPVIEKKGENTYSPLNNLYIVSSQAQILKDERKSMDDVLTEIDSILDEGCKRITGTLPKGYWNNRTKMTGYEYDETQFRNRFFSYSKDYEQLKESFERDLKQLLETIPNVVEKNSKKIMMDLSDELTNELREHMKQLKDESVTKKQKELNLKKLKEQYPNLVKSIEEEEEKVITEFRRMRTESKERLNYNIMNVLNVDEIVKRTELLNLKNRKDDRDLLISFVNSSVEQAYKNIVNQENEKIKTLVEQYMETMETDIFTDKNLLSHNASNAIYFDVKKAFISGVAGAVTYGGLAFYMSTLGNLGGYILVTKAVGVLSALGISVGGTATAVSAVSAMGGPITLAIGLGVAAALIAYSVSGIGWRKSLARRIVKLFEKEGVAEEYEKLLDTYWSDTERAFQLGTEKVIADLKEEIKQEEMWLKLNDKQHEELMQQLLEEKHFAKFLYSI